jgi:hypothetical protein
LNKELAHNTFLSRELKYCGHHSKTDQQVNNFNRILID